MTIARPAGSGGGVTSAEVNLKFVWEVVSRIKIGENGLAYVVDADGKLIAHPDISLVLQEDRPERAAAGGLAEAAPARRSNVAGARTSTARPVLSADARDPDARLDRLRRVAARRGLRAALCPTLRARRWCSVAGAAGLDGGELLPGARAGAAAARAAGRRGADRRRRAGPAHRGRDRRRARGAGRAVQPHERAAARVVRRARAQGRAAHRRADRIARVPDRDQRRAARDQPIADRRRRRCSKAILDSAVRLFGSAKRPSSATTAAAACSWWPGSTRRGSRGGDRALPAQLSRSGLDDGRARWSAVPAARAASTIDDVTERPATTAAATYRQLARACSACRC